jgi:serine/threonine protein kinase
MELVRGMSLADLIQVDGPLSPQRTAEIGLKMLEALSAAHGAGVLHRDVKPSNVLLNGTRVVLTDFGAAAIQGDPGLTSSGMVLGTPAYLAPERAMGGAAQVESDLWSLGATLYAAVEGYPPYGGDNPQAVLYTLMIAQPPIPRRAGQLAPVLMGLLDRDPAKRPSPELIAGMLADVAGISRPLEQFAAASAASPQVLPPAHTHPATVVSDPPHSRDVPRGHAHYATTPDTVTQDARASQASHLPAAPEYQRYAHHAAELSDRRHIRPKPQVDLVGLAGLLVVTGFLILIPAVVIFAMTEADPWFLMAIFPAWGLAAAGFSALRRIVRRHRT